MSATNERHRRGRPPEILHTAEYSSAPVRPRRFEGHARISSSVLYGRPGGHCGVHEMRQEGRPVLCGQAARATGPIRLAAHEAIVLPVPHEGTCQGVPPLRREPYAGLRRVSHEPCPERSRRRGRRVLARRLRARADRRGARDHRPGRSQDGHQRTELWPEDRHGQLRGQQAAGVRQPDQRAAFSAQCVPEAVQAVLAGLRGVEDAAGIGQRPHRRPDLVGRGRDDGHPHPSGC